jgi:hypothetical protein
VEYIYSQEDYLMAWMIPTPDVVDDDDDCYADLLQIQLPKM